VRHRLIGFSGGKDSTLVAALVFEAVLMPEDY
jgi:PP-loop superfamily ATP-utilizing enzyme